jgi:hypothetical protein
MIGSGLEPCRHVPGFQVDVIGGDAAALPRPDYDLVQISRAGAFDHHWWCRAGPRTPTTLIVDLLAQSGHSVDRDGDRPSRCG